MENDPQDYAKAPLRQILKNLSLKCEYFILPLVKISVTKNSPSFWPGSVPIQSLSTPSQTRDLRTYQISKTLALRGPNLWSTLTLIECWVEVWPRPDVHPLWRENLHTWLPDFAPPSGDDLTKPALAFLFQQLCLHLQNSTGTHLAFGRVLPIDGGNLYRIIFQYDEETVGREALALAGKILEAALRGETFDVATALEDLRELAADVSLGPSTRAMVNAALAAGIPVNRLTEGSLVQLGYGSQQRKILAAATSYTSAIAEDIVQDKDLTRRLLQEVGLPVPAGRPVSSPEDAWAAAQEIGLPVVVKPRDGNQGRGVAVNLFTREQVMAAFEAAKEESSSVITEQFAEGQDYRLLVVGRQLVAAARRLPANVVGDGIHTITQLIAIANQDPRRASDHAAALSKIRIDQVALGVLHEQEVTPDSVPAKERVIFIRRNANLSTGGTAVDVTDEVHPSIREAMIEAAQTVGLDICGIDLVAHDVSLPLGKGNGAIIELNARPGLRMHLFPSEGKSRPVGEAVIEMMFPPGDQGRIPVVAVTGVNGKTTTTRFTAHLLEQVGHRVGFTSTDGIFVGRRKLDEGDCSGPKSARLVLSHPLVDAAVLETARGGILREGLAFDRCDVAIITNIGDGDHLGLGGIDTVEKLADVKSCLLKTVSPDGCAVLNASDPLVVAMAMPDPRHTIFFALDGQNPIIQRHREAGGRAVYTHGGNIIRAEGEWEMNLIPLTDVPLTHGGKVGFQVENTLAAVAAAWALGIADDLVRQGCRSFQPTLEQNAGRFNTLELGELTVIVDYGHNPSALRKLLEAVENYPQTHRISVYSAPGDRRDEDILEQGKMLSRAFDEVWLYEGDYCRGREPGEIMGLLSQGLVNAPRVKRLEKITGSLKALDLALAAAPPGSLVVVQADTADETVAHLQSVYGAV
jgi:cyanophycin synthetase